MEASDDEDSTAASMVAELKRRREEADAREKALDAREQELKARETALDSEMKKLQSIRDDIAKVDESRGKENDARVAKIVETVETMSPKAAAPLLAKIMNVMEPHKSARLSELLAGVVRAKSTESERAPAHIASNGATETASKSAKGGE
jgi:flagellar motility protein MotE (MotC chaperone)